MADERGYQDGALPSLRYLYMKIRTTLAAAAAWFLVLSAATACNDAQQTTEDEPADAGDAAVDVAAADTDVGETDGAPITIDVNIVACDDEDGLSPNHSGDEAYLVDSGFLRQDGLHICADTDDWFLVEGSEGQRITARIEFADRVGDLDLYLLPAAGDHSLESAVAVSGSREDVEELVFDVPADRAYLVRVNSFEGASGAYDLFIAVSCGDAVDCADGFRCSYIEGHCVDDEAPICGDDALEPNDGIESATPIEPASDGFAYLHGLSVCEEDDDYFVLELDAPSSVYAELAFDAGNDLDLRIFDTEGREVAQAATEEGNPELLEWPVVAAGTYIFVVDHFVTELGNDVGYNLTVEVVPESCDSNGDCGSVAGRQLCEDGACVAFQPVELSAPGGPCDDASDCDGGLACYENAPGFDDNFCTAQCGADGDCRLFESGYCLVFWHDGICFPACSDDTDCPAYYACQDDGRCDLDPCRVDGDCDEGQLCRYTERQGRGFCTAAEFAECRSDDTSEENDVPGEASTLGSDADLVDDLAICDVDDDWFELEISEPGSRLNVDVAWDSTADLDVFVFDELGRLLAAATSADRNPEQVDVRFLDAGVYRIRVNQFPGERDLSTAYSLSFDVVSESCTVDGEECLDLMPLRVVCDEDGGGGCRHLDGDGTVDLGGLCDSDDDCVDTADVCWAFEPATARRNICTIGCENDGDCASVPGTACERVGRGFAACLP